MSGTTVEEDAIDEILYLSRVNEVTELAAYISQLSQQTKHSKPDLVAAAVDPYSKNSALHYAAANGHIGTCFSFTGNKHCFGELYADCRRQTLSSSCSPSTRTRLRRLRRGLSTRRMMRETRLSIGQR